MTQRSMRVGFVAGLMVATALTVAPVAAQSPSALEIMLRVHERDDGDMMTADQQMILIDRNGNQRVRDIALFARDREGYDSDRLSVFLSPADVRDTMFLTYDYYCEGCDDDQWLYLPELRRTRRIATSDQSSSFMGSDLSYADMTRRVIEEWDYTLVREDEVNGHPVWLIETTPISEEIADRYGYERSVVFVRQDIDMVIRAVHWLQNGDIKYIDMPEVELIDGIWVATRTEVRTTRNRQTEHATVLTLDNVQFNQDLDPDLFTTRTLERGM